VFIDVPRRIRNPDWQELGIEPIESAMREQLGEIVAPEDLQTLPDVISRQLGGREEFVQRVRTLRDGFVYRLGHSIPDGADEIARLAEQQRRFRVERLQDDD